MKDLRVALAQITCRLGAVEENVAKHREYAQRAAAEDARVICFPELSLTGYPRQRSDVDRLAQPVDGELAQALQGLASETGLIILSGYIEREASGSVYNTQIVSRPRAPIEVYRKVHVPNTENDRFGQGSVLDVFHSDEATFGVQICYDNHFPEASRVLALRGAEVIFAPYGSPGPCTLEGLNAKRSRWMRYLTARAFDNSVYVVVVNQVGDSGAAKRTAAMASTPRDTHSELAQYPGGSMVLNPWGEVIAQTYGAAEQLLVVDLDASTLDEKRRNALQSFYQFRRPDLYGDVTAAMQP